MNNIRNLIKLFSKREKRNLFFLFLLMLIAALLETIGIGLIVPFIGIVTNPNIMEEQEVLLFVYELFNFQSSNGFLIFATICLILVFVIKNFYLLLFYYIQYRFINNQRVKKSQKLLNSYLTKPYEFHLQRNTAELLRNVNHEVNRVFEHVMIPYFLLATEALVIVCILALLIIIEPIATIFSVILLGASVVVFFKVFRTKIGKLGQIQQQSNGQMIKWINQGLGASKEVKVSGKESFFINAFTMQSQTYAKAQRFFQMLTQVPRMFIETIIVATILGMMLLIILRGEELSALISTMALFAMAAFRLMPSINRIVGALTTIKYNSPALDVIYEDLSSNEEIKQNMNVRTSKLQNKSSRAYNQSIELKNVYYRYSNQSNYNIQNVSLQIPIGSSVAFIGTSGAGKTTIVDIILGLLEPEKGTVLIDGKNLKTELSLWQKKIGYIPQTIYLSDDSIRHNVAFGIDDKEIDDAAVWRAIEDAQMKEFIEEMPDKLDTFVGERGVRLSGGQRQRIGIARALYHDPEILFLDEATSALDNDTEKEIMKAINQLKGQKTLIIIAHRLSTIENCDIVFEMEAGRLIAQKV
ncbi:ABC transporter ATP-binding protein [Psychrobacillus sp.]|uniref:ABC transporter ATP-binding protein n=1 Tax=Psychrobacillus sp. TaxID=1871623 RepID=UPI0028BE74FF|nr:ABC transporter ATP-binding protein [Psychrobacillus sp.]